MPSRPIDLDQQLAALGEPNYKMIRIVRCLFLLALTAVPAGDAAAADNWKKYSSAQDGFEAEFPGEVRVIPKSLSDSAKKVSDRATDYGQEGDGYAFAVHAVRFTRPVPFDAAVRVYYGALGCKTTTGQHALKRDGATASQIFGKACLNGKDVEVRYFAKGLWFYQVLAATDEGRTVAGARRFFDSFRLTSP